MRNSADGPSRALVTCDLPIYLQNFIQFQSLLALATSCSKMSKKLLQNSSKYSHFGLFS